jgi:hypothetical protein
MYESENDMKFNIDKFLKENDDRKYFKELKLTSDSDYLKILLAIAYQAGGIDTLNMQIKANKKY